MHVSKSLILMRKNKCVKMTQLFLAGLHGA
jgi:hypothetical protein